MGQDNAIYNFFNIIMIISSYFLNYFNKKP